MDWKERMLQVMLSNFKENKQVGDVFLIATMNGDEINHMTFEIGDIPKNLIRPAIVDLIDNFKPDAFIVIMTHNMVLRQSSEIEAMKKEFDEVGSVDKMKDCKEVIVFTYETGLVSNVSIYEVIRTDNDAVLNESTLMSAMDIEQDVFFTGILNRGRHHKLLQILN